MRFKINKNYTVEANNQTEVYEKIIKKEGINIEKVVPVQEVVIPAKPEIITPPKIEIIDIRNSLPKTGSNGTMNKSKMDKIIVHHDAQFRPASYSSLARYRAQAQIHVNRGWRHISYHYIIDNVGSIFQCLDETEVGYHAGVYAINLNSIAIKLDGNFETQKPTEAQIRSYKALITHLTTQRPDLPKILKSSIRGHRDVKATLCPGKNFYPLIRNV